MTPKQKTLLSKGKHFLAGMGITIAGALSIAWGTMKWSENKIVRPYVREIVVQQFDSLYKPYMYDSRLVREMMDLTMPDSIKKKAKENVEKSPFWATR